MATPGTYSFRSVRGAITPSTFPPFAIVGGNLGVGQFVIARAAEHTQHDVAADGVTMVSYISNDTGSLSIECQQISLIDTYLLGLYNYLDTRAKASDATELAATSIYLIGPDHAHELSGVSFSKVPDRTYTGAGSKVTWMLMAAYVSTL